MKIFILFLVSIFIFACSVKEYTIQPNLKPAVYCIREFYYESPEPVLKDLLYKSLNEAINSINGKIECSDKTDYYIDFRLNNISFVPVGYSDSLRAFVYIAQANVGFKMYDRDDKLVISNDIVEKVQYVGSGMRADFEKRYAFDELSDVMKIRIYSLLTSHGN